MGLITCYECKLSVSTNAVCCPNCGNTRFIEQRIADNKRIKLESESRIKEANENAKKLGYANASEKFHIEYEANKRVEKVKDLFGFFIGGSVLLIIVVVVIWFFYRFFYPYYPKFTSGIIVVVVLWFLSFLVREINLFYSKK